MSWASWVDDLLGLEKPKRQTTSEVVRKCDNCKFGLTKRHGFYLTNSSKKVYCKNCVNYKYFGWCFGWWNEDEVRVFRGWTAFRNGMMFEELEK